MSVNILDGLLSKFKLTSSAINPEYDNVVDSLYVITIDTRKRGLKILESVHTLPDDSLQQVLNGLFDDNITWGRVFMSFALIVEVLEKECFHPNSFNHNYNIFVNAFKSKIKPWVTANGCWEQVIMYDMAEKNENYRKMFDNLSTVVIFVSSLWALSRLFFN